MWLTVRFKKLFYVFDPNIKLLSVGLIWHCAGCHPTAHHLLLKRMFGARQSTCAVEAPASYYRLSWSMCSLAELPWA
jgi:hypothetical protein